MGQEKGGVTCPICGRVSYHPKDKENRFCGVCGFWDDRLILLVDAPHFSAAAVIGNGLVRRAAPIIKYMVDWTAERAVAYAQQKGWTVFVTRSLGGEESEPKGNITASDSPTKPPTEGSKS